MAAKEESRGARAMRNILTRRKSSSDPNISKPANTAVTVEAGGEGGAKQNGEMVRRMPSSRSRTPPVERKHKFASLGRLFKPWKWKRKKKSDKFAETQRSLERKISVRANRDDLIQKGILMPDTPTSAPPAPVGDAPDLLKERDHLNGTARTSPVTQHQAPAPPYSVVAAPAGARTPGPTPPSRPDRPDRPASMGCSLRGDYVVPVPAPSEQRFSLSRLPEPPIAVSDIGPIPPPPMFSNGMGGQTAAATAPGGSVSVTAAPPLDLSDPRFDDLEEEEVVCGDYDDDDDDDEYYPMVGPASRGDEPPPRQPRFDLKPLRSALKKPRPTEPAAAAAAAVAASAAATAAAAAAAVATAGTLTGQSPARPAGQRQDAAPVPFRFGAVRESAASCALAAADDSDDSDGPIPYRDEPGDGDSGVLTRLGSRVQRTDSLALKLALRPDRQELIDRNIIQVATEQDRTDWRSELAAKLNRRLSLRPTTEELEERNILKRMSREESIRDMEAKKATLLRKLSFRPTVEELKQRKVIHFNDYVDVTQAHEYDRRADKPWTRLTPRDKAMIRKELNDFKSSEMDVHEDSRHLTRFHRP